MGGESSKPASTPAGAVFLSYASDDAAAAQRICDSLRASGVAVWFDQSELRGGDAWDRQIRRQIRECTLFVPIISTNSQARHEGYFRLEWDLADQRTHLMGRNRAFVVPVCIDATPERDADVPDSFLAVQWTRLPDSQTTAEFVARIKRLLSAEPPTTARLPSGAVSSSSPIPPTLRAPSALKRALPTAIALLGAGAIVFLLADRLWKVRHAATAPPAASNEGATVPAGTPPVASATAAFNPPQHSVAVLPFVNISGDKEQEYFSEGLTEELLNSLSRISELQVAARTSSFSFQGQHPDIATVAHKLNVGAVLEGSVRRSAHTVRITAQLVNSVTGSTSGRRPMTGTSVMC